MKILFVIMNASLGGHTRSATIVAEELRKRGHDILFVIGEKCDSRVIEHAGFNVFRSKVDWLGRFANLQHDVSQLIVEGNFTIVHSFSDYGMLELVRACKYTATRFYYTNCGGRTPASLLPVRPIITFSEEVRSELLARGPWLSDDIFVIPARVNVQLSDTKTAAIDPKILVVFRNKYAVPEDAKIILRIARMDSVYINSILQGIQTAVTLHQQGINVCFVHIGFYRPEAGKWVFNAIKRAVAEANERCGAIVAISAQDEALTATQYLPIADVVIGAGRSAFESMIMKKPTLVVGESGFAGVVKPKTIDELAYYNFSGRNVHQTIPFAESTAIMSQEVKKLFEDDNYALETGLFSREYVLKKLDVGFAVTEYLRLYQESEQTELPDEAILQAFQPKLSYLLKNRIFSLNMRTYLQKVLRGK